MLRASQDLQDFKILLVNDRVDLEEQLARTAKLIGGKVNVYRSLVLVSNFIVPLNRSQGLRADFVWALGVEYTFGGPE